jgi:hypothetical protein
VTHRHERTHHDDHLLAFQTRRVHDVCAHHPTRLLPPSSVACKRR